MFSHKEYKGCGIQNILNKVFVLLEDGTIFQGYSPFQGSADLGELVFNTSMTGYQEVCTDPSYANQSVVFTTSHVGNVGVNPFDQESKNIWVKGVIASKFSRISSNWRAEKSFLDFLDEKKVIWVEGVDTRRLAKHLRDYGSQKGRLVVKSPQKAKAAFLLNQLSQKKEEPLFHSVLQSQSVHKKVIESNQSGLHVCIYDFGVKASIVDQVARWASEIIIVPGTKQASDILSFRPDAIVLSNGPGDPSSSLKLIHNIEKLTQAKIPMLGVCLGHQLLGIALGAKTKKMSFGHHGVNHPVFDLEKEVIYISSQNHNYILDEKNFPCCLQITHRSLFDGTIQGFISEELPVMGFQGHPEGSPGPSDLDVFQKFHQLVLKIQAERLKICQSINP